MSFFLPTATLWSFFPKLYITLCGKAPAGRSIPPHVNPGWSCLPRPSQPWEAQPSVRRPRRHRLEAQEEGARRARAAIRAARAEKAEPGTHSKRTSTKWDARRSVSSYRCLLTHLQQTMFKNIVAKGEIVHNRQFHILPQYFQLDLKIIFPF